MRTANWTLLLGFVASSICFCESTEAREQRKLSRWISKISCPKQVHEVHCETGSQLCLQVVPSSSVSCTPFTNFEGVPQVAACERTCHCCEESTGVLNFHQIPSIGDSKELANSAQAAKPTAGMDAQAEADRIAKEQAAKVEADRVAKEKEVAEIAAKQKAEMDAQAETDRIAKEQAAKVEADRVAKEKEDAEIAAKQKAEMDAQAEADRIAKEQAAKVEADRVAKEKEDAEIAAKQKAEMDAQAEADRIAKEQAAKEEADRVAKQNADAESVATKIDKMADANVMTRPIGGQQLTLQSIQIAAKNASGSSWDVGSDADISIEITSADKKWLSNLSNNKNSVSYNVQVGPFNIGDTIKINVMDKDVIVNDFIGSTEHTLTDSDLANGILTLSFGSVQEILFEIKSK